MNEWIGRKGCSRKELESLVGKLGHAAKVVRPGKTFMRRLFELIGVAWRPHHRIRLSRSVRSDLIWWAMFIEAWNGTSMMWQQTIVNPHLDSRFREFRLWWIQPPD